MRKTLLRLICMNIAIAGALFEYRAFAQKLPSCGDEAVTYTPFDERFAAKMSIPTRKIIVLITGEKQFSPQKTRWMALAEPDYSKSGPWSTTLLIQKVNARVPEILTFKDHANGGVQVRWLNEKLLYGSVSWGRIVSTDFIFDVEKKVFVYREMANYGEFVQPCK